MAIEQGQYTHLFDLAKTPIELWDERAKIPGLKSVMSLGKSEATLEVETQVTKNRLFTELGDVHTKAVLEIGTGIGRFTDELIQNTAFIASVDISRNMLKRSKQNSNKSHLLQAAGQNLPLQDAIFDTVFEATVLIHILDDEVFRQFIAESMRVLKPGGQILFCDPMAQEQSIQKHPYLKHRTISDYQNAAGIPLENRGSLDLSTNSLTFLVGTKPSLTKSTTVK